ncbi:MAG: hypothetical protein JXB60_03070 [Candidatus Cloacimonetes bacterium]|nr:hypothetical protein [Candidatus Cloacimonadota bacterium]
MRKYLTPLIILIIIGCSSLPKKRIPDTGLEATRYLKSAGNAEMHLEYRRALLLYEKSYNAYTSVDDIPGKVTAGLGMARISYFLENEDEHDFWLGKITALVNNNRSDLIPLLTLHHIRIGYDKMDYDSVLDLTVAFKTDNDEWVWEATCFRALALLRTGSPAASEKDNLIRALPSLEKRFRKNKLQQLELYPFLLYTLGYIFTTDYDWSEAISYFSRARLGDQEIDNAIGVADDLYALARCYELTGSLLQAGDHYNRAAEIYCLLGAERSCQECKQKVAELNR